MEDKLTNEEQTLFDSLSKEHNPSADLEDKVVNELKKRNLIQPQGTMTTHKKKKWMLGVAASLTLFLLGFVFGNTFSGGPADISTGYILLLHEDERFRPQGSEMEVFTEYATWMGKMMMNGVNITGKELAPESTYWLGEETAEIAEVRRDKISGYFIIDVQDRDEAERIAKSSPHIKYGGTVELIKLSERN